MGWVWGSCCGMFWGRAFKAVGTASGDFIWAQLMVFPFSRGKVLQRAGSYKTTQTGILEKVPSPQ